MEQRLLSTSGDSYSRLICKLLPSPCFELLDVLQHQAVLLTLSPPSIYLRRYQIARNGDGARLRKEACDLTDYSLNHGVRAARSGRD